MITSMTGTRNSISQFARTSYGFSKYKALKSNGRKSICNIQKRFFNANTTVSDIAIIGGGAAGMSAAISARYEGYKVTVFESRHNLGGCFSNTPLIHNIPGFPIGISGSSLSQGAQQQAIKLGAICHYGTTILKISKNPNHFVLQDHQDKKYEAQRIILSTGVKYRKLEVLGADYLENKGIYYEVEDTVVGKINNQLPIIIYGGGNSAGQAAMFYQSNGANIHIIFRGADLESTMSQYLIERIQRAQIKLFPNTVITSVEGSDWISKISIKNQKTGEERKLDTEYLFTMIGGIPPELPQLDFAKFDLDHRGYVVINGGNSGKMDFSTSVEGIYAAGDITSFGAGRIILSQAQGVMAFMQAALSLNPKAAL